jgi:hypothetical protein
MRRERLSKTAFPSRRWGICIPEFRTRGNTAPLPCFGCTVIRPPAAETTWPARKSEPNTPVGSKRSPHPVLRPAMRIPSAQLSPGYRSCLSRDTRNNSMSCEGHAIPQYADFSVCLSNPITWLLPTNISNFRLPVSNKTGLLQVNLAGIFLYLPAFSGRPSPSVSPKTQLH